MNVSQSKETIFPKGDKAPADYFTGNAFIKMLVAQNSAFNTTVANVVFEPGCRNNWHFHKGGQILVCIDGEGYYQEKGNPIQLLHKGDVVQILPNVIHWHGATPHSEFTHIAIGPNSNAGTAEWLQPVTDAEYNSYNG